MQVGDEARADAEVAGHVDGLSVDEDVEVLVDVQHLALLGERREADRAQALHIHQHLDIFVDGKPVPVPGDLGIGQGFISDLHTHASYPPGIIHVESPADARFSLGQFFAVWGVPLSATCIGSLCEAGDKRLRAWVNGTEVTADPTRIVLEEHQQIVLAYGTAAQEPKPVPASYAWPEGL